LLIAVVVVEFAEEPKPEALVLLLDASAFEGAVSTPEAGVYGTGVVVAFEPAEDDPDDENEDEAPGPDAPEDAFAWIYKSSSVLGFD
jgi:hypothetical protein